MAPKCTSSRRSAADERSPRGLRVGDGRTAIPPELRGGDDGAAGSDAPPPIRPEDDRGVDDHEGDRGDGKSRPEVKRARARSIGSKQHDHVSGPDAKRRIVEIQPASPVPADRFSGSPGRMSVGGGVAPVVLKVKRAEDMDGQQSPAGRPGGDLDRPRSGGAAREEHEDSCGKAADHGSCGPGDRCCSHRSVPVPSADCLNCPAAHKTRARQSGRIVPYLRPASCRRIV